MIKQRPEFNVSVRIIQRSLHYIILLLVLKNNMQQQIITVIPLKEQSRELKVALRSYVSSVTSVDIILESKPKNGK